MYKLLKQVNILAAFVVVVWVQTPYFAQSATNGVTIGYWPQLSSPGDRPHLPSV